MVLRRSDKIWVWNPDTLAVELAPPDEQGVTYYVAEEALMLYLSGQIKFMERKLEVVKKRFTEMGDDANNGGTNYKEAGDG